MILQTERNPVRQIKEETKIQTSQRLKKLLQRFYIKRRPMTSMVTLNFKVLKNRPNNVFRSTIKD